MYIKAGAANAAGVVGADLRTVTGHFAYETFRLLVTSPTTWTFRLYMTCRHQSHY